MTGLVFTQPAMLWGLLAASLPTIIHLINRHRARRKRFAAIDFLFRVQRQSARRILLKQLLLLIIRTLLIAALVLAGAGPVLLPSGTELQIGPTSRCLVIDASLSMTAKSESQSRFEAARAKARDLVRGMGPYDATCLIAAGAENHALVGACSDSPSVLLDGIDEARIEWGRSDLSAAIGQAAAILARCPGPNRQIILLTDAARHAFPSPPAWPPGVPLPQVLLHDLASGSSRDNHAVLEIEQAASGPSLELSVRMVHHGESAAGEQPVEVALSDEIVARGFVELTPDEPIRKLFTVRPPQEAWALGAVRLPADNLTADDQLAFRASGRRAAQALLINGDMRPVLHRDELFYLEHALSPSGNGRSGIRFTTITPDRLTEEMLQSAEVVFLANVRELGPVQLGALRDWVIAGGGLFLSMGDRVDVEHSNQMLGDLLPLNLRDVVSLGPTDPDGTHRKGISFGEFDMRHPVLAIFQADGGKAIKSIRTRRAVVLEPGQTDQSPRVLIRYGNGAPALVEGRAERGRVMLFASSLDRDWTNWPTRASFLPFLQHAVAYLAGSLDELPAPQVPIGGRVRIPLLAGADGARIRRTDGSPIELGRSDIQQGHLIFADTDRPGWHQIEQLQGTRVLSGHTIPGFFVRLPASESDLSPLPAQQLQDLLGQAARLTIAGGDDPATRSRAVWFLLLSLALVLCEALLIRR
jgi:hypothetical protein